MDPVAIVAIAALVCTVLITGLVAFVAAKSYGMGEDHGEATSDRDHAEAMLEMEREQLKNVLAARDRIREKRRVSEELSDSDAVSSVFIESSDL